MRLDQALAARGLCVSREQAKKLILSGAILHNGKIAQKPNAPVDENDILEVAKPPRYVSRGGLKLEAALDAPHQIVDGRRLDDDLPVGEHAGDRPDHGKADGCSPDCCVFACSALAIAGNPMMLRDAIRESHRHTEMRRLLAAMPASNLRPPRA